MFEDGAVHVSAIPPVLFAVATTLLGVFGALRATTSFDSVDHGPKPAAFETETRYLKNEFEFSGKTICALVADSSLVEAVLHRAVRQP